MATEGGVVLCDVVQFLAWGITWAHSPSSSDHVLCLGAEGTALVFTCIITLRSHNVLLEMPTWGVRSD